MVSPCGWLLAASDTGTQIHDDTPLAWDPQSASGQLLRLQPGKHTGAQVGQLVRGKGHFFSPSLVDSQFDTLESPAGEPSVLRVDAMNKLTDLRASVLAWL